MFTRSTFNFFFLKIVEEHHYILIYTHAHSKIFTALRPTSKHTCTSLLLSVPSQTNNQPHQSHTITHHPSPIISSRTTKAFLSPQKIFLKKKMRRKKTGAVLPKFNSKKSSKLHHSNTKSSSHSIYIIITIITIIIITSFLFTFQKESTSSSSENVVQIVQRSPSKSYIPMTKEYVDPDEPFEMDQRFLQAIRKSQEPPRYVRARERILRKPLIPT